MATPALAGGVLAAAGALLPWFTFFANLQSMRGISGLYGWLVLAAGVASAGLAGWFVWRGAPRALRASGAIGLGLLAFTLWLLPRQFATRDRLLTNPMLVPEMGPGIFVAIGGALLVSTTLLVMRRSAFRMAEGTS